MERRKRQKKSGPESLDVRKCSVRLEEQQTIKRNGADEYYRLK